MVDMTAPMPQVPSVTLPAAAGFLIAASEYMQEQHGDVIFKTEVVVGLTEVPSTGTTDNTMLESAV